MCAICGCGTAKIDAETVGSAQSHEHSHGDGHAHAHSLAHPHSAHDTHAHGDDLLDFGKGPAGVHVPGMSQTRAIRIERDILAQNDMFAVDNRRVFAERGILALNFVSSPGSGKTSLLVRTVTDLANRFPVAVIEGDQQTSHDADRIRATGAPAVQINTGKGCHLDAHMVGHALDRLPLQTDSLLFIENVGNLVCPAAFDLGEAHKVVVLSVTEGEDKPLKYPDMFAAADLMLLTKVDLLPFLDFDVAACVAAALSVNPEIAILLLSTRSGEGLPAFYDWIARRVPVARDADLSNASGQAVRQG
jgi:hydrogenase nickel incorporation protein HypB